MSTVLLTRLQKLERDYYAGVAFKLLTQRVVALSRAIRRLDRGDPLREACEDFAPTLWDQPSGSVISEGAVRDALSGSRGGDCLRSWAHFSRVVQTYRIAA